MTHPQDTPSNTGPCYFQLSSLYSRPKYIRCHYLGTIGRLSHFSFGMELQSTKVWQQTGTAEVHGLNQPQYTSPASQSQPSIGWWHFPVRSHSTFISFLLKSYPAFPVTTDGLQHSYLLTKVDCKSKIWSHNTFPQIFFTARSNFKPWYYCSRLTIWNVVWQQDRLRRVCLLAPKSGWKATSQIFRILKLQLKKMNIYIIFLSLFSSS